MADRLREIEKRENALYKKMDLIVEELKQLAIEKIELNSQKLREKAVQEAIEQVASFPHSEGIKEENAVSMSANATEFSVLKRNGYDY